MMRQLTVCACALVALLLLCSDASAQGCAPVYGGYGYAPSYGYAVATVTPSYYAPSYSYPASYYTPSYYYAPTYGYASSYADLHHHRCRPRHTRGGRGGPYSGLGVRPGLGSGGFGLRR